MVAFRGLAAYPGSMTRPLKALFTLITSPLAQRKKKVSSLKVSTGDTKSEERRAENVFSSIDFLSAVNRRLLSWTRAASEEFEKFLPRFY